MQTILRRLLSASAPWCRSSLTRFGLLNIGLGVPGHWIGRESSFPTFGETEWAFYFASAIVCFGSSVWFQLYPIRHPGLRVKRAGPLVMEGLALFPPLVSANALGPAAGFARLGILDRRSGVPGQRGGRASSFPTPLVSGLGK